MKDTVLPIEQFSQRSPKTEEKPKQGTGALEELEEEFHCAVIVIIKYKLIPSHINTKLGSRDLFISLPIILYIGSGFFFFLI